MTVYTIMVHFSFPFLDSFPHIDAFWSLCSRQLFENIVTKEEIAQNQQFLLLPRWFPLLVIGIHSIIEIFYFLTKYIQSRLLQNCSMRERFFCKTNSSVTIIDVCRRFVPYGRGISPSNPMPTAFSVLIASLYNKYYSKVCA